MKKRKNNSFDPFDSSNNTWSADNSIGTFGISDDRFTNSNTQSSSQNNTSPDGFGWGGSANVAPVTDQSWTSDESQDAFLGMNAPAVNNGTSSTAPPSGSQKKMIPILVVAALLCIILLLFFFFNRPQKTKDPLSVQWREENGCFAVDFSFQLKDLNPQNAYAAGFMLSVDDQFPQAVTEPVFITGQDHFTVESSLIIYEEGDYKVYFYYYALTNPAVITSDPQDLNLRFSGSAERHPVPGPAWSSPIPRATATPRPTSTPTPRITASPTPIRNFTLATPIPFTTATPYPLEPSSSVYLTYPSNTRYFYHQLTDKEKRIFSQIYDGVNKFAERIDFYQPCTEAEFDRILFVLRFDCPELFQLDLSYNYYNNSSGQLIAIVPHYVMTSTEYTTAFRQVMTKIRSLSSQPNFNRSDFDKQYIIYRQLIQNNDYNKVLDHCGTAYSAWMLGYSKCSGYTRALNLALRYYGIPCCEVWGNTYDNGAIDPESHLWTALLLDGQWYHCDATWDDPVTDSYFDPFGNSVPILPYLNLPDAQMMRARTYHPDIPMTLPVCNSDDMNFYNVIGAKVPYGANIEAIVHDNLDDCLINGKNAFALSFDSTLDFNTMMNSDESFIFNWRHSPGGKRCTYYLIRSYPESNLIIIENLQFN